MYIGLLLKCYTCPVCGNYKYFIYCAHFNNTLVKTYLIYPSIYWYITRIFIVSLNCCLYRIAFYSQTHLSSINGSLLTCRDIRPLLLASKCVWYNLRIQGNPKTRV